MNKDRLVFVYGTLRKGCVNDINKHKEGVKYITDGYVFGTLYLATDWFPGISLNSNNKVFGEVYSVAPAIEGWLDMLEGVDHGLYTKETVIVQTKVGSLVDCLIYQASPSLVQGKPIIEYGDWTIYTGKV